MRACIRVDAATAAAWRALLEVGGRDSAGVDVEVVDYPAPQPLSALWSRPDLGCAFMCGYPFAHAAPQPDDSRRAGAQSRRDTAGSPCTGPISSRGGWAVAHLEDAFGKRIACTTRIRNRAGTRRDCCSRPTRSDAAPAVRCNRRAALSRRAASRWRLTAGEADVGPLDSYAHDLLRRHEPALAASRCASSLRPATPIPPLVGRPRMDARDARRLREALVGGRRGARTRSAPRNVASARIRGRVAARRYDVLRNAAEAASMRWLSAPRVVAVRFALI